MRKNRRVRFMNVNKLILVTFLTIFLVGCGHKSKAELTDITQFSCSDSITTVYDVLGTTEISDNNCKYSGLNLWGYEGNVTFRLRDDNDTIREFGVRFEKLNDKELNDIKEQLRNQFGEYEEDRSDAAKQTSYKWELDDEAEQYGFDRFWITSYDSGTVSFSFSDEWTYTKDEAYYSHLEELNKEDEVEYLLEEKYSLPNEDTLQMFLTKKGEELEIPMVFTIKKKTDAFTVGIAISNILSEMKKEDETMANLLSYIIYVEEDGAMMSGGGGTMSFIMKDSKFISSDEYFSSEWISENATEMNTEYLTVMKESFLDFLDK